MRDSHLTADRRDIDDGGTATAVAVKGGLREEVRESGLRGVKGGVEVVRHRQLKGFDRLVFQRTDLDDTGAVDENINPLEMADSELDHLLRSNFVGEIGGKKEDVGGVCDIAGGEQGGASFFKVGLAAGDQDQTGAGTAVDTGKLKAKAAGAAGDEHDRTVPALRLRAGAEKPGRSEGRDGYGDLGCTRGIEGQHNRVMQVASEIARGALMGLEDVAFVVLWGMAKGNDLMPRGGESGRRCRDCSLGAWIGTTAPGRSLGQRDGGTLGLRKCV